MNNNIEKILKHKGLKVSWLARKAGIARSTVNNVITGKTKPKIETLQKISGALDLPLTIIFGGNNNGINKS